MNRQLFARAWMLLLTAVIAIPLSAQQLTVQVDNEGGLWDALEAQGVTNFAGIKNLKVTGVMGNQDFLLIKNQMSNLEVLDISGTNATEVPYKTFYQKEKLKTVRLPEDISYIRNEAFWNCPLLESVTFGNQAVVEGKIVFPSTLRYVEGYAFRDCKKLTHLDFSACSSLECLSNDAFCNMFNLQEVLFPSQGNFRLEWGCFRVDNIWDETTGNWIYKGLEKLTLTKAVTSMSDNCLPRTLKTLYVESSTPPSCDENTFSEIINNETVSIKVYVPKGSKRNYAIANGWGRLYQYMQEMGLQLAVSGYGSVQQDNRTYTDGDVVFVNADGTTTLKAVTEVGCELISVKLNGNAVSVAADGTFTVPAGTTVGTLELAFTSAPMVVNNPNGGELKDNIAALGSNPRAIRALKVVGKLTTKDWTYIKSALTVLEDFDISETDVEVIPEYAFQENQKIKAIHLPSTVVTIDRYAFQNCQKLTTVEGCENVEAIRERAFQYCSQLANFPFGDKLQSIESAVFENCSSLPESLVMPVSVTSLGRDNMFNGSSVRSFDLSQCEIRCDFGYNAFGKCTSLLLPEKGDYRLCYQALKDAELTELRLPAALSSVYGEDVFPTILKRLYVSRTTPIDVSSNAFNNIDFDNCTLYVPSGSSEAYEAASYWSNFYDVKELGFKIIITGFGSVKLGNIAFSNGDVYMPMQGSTATLKAVPDQECQLLSVTINGNAVSVAADGSFTIPDGANTGTINVAFSISQTIVDNSNGGELKDKIAAMGLTPNKVRALKVIGKMANKDWNYVMSSLSELQEFDISETSVKSVPESAFQNKEKLSTVHLPSTVTTINNYAFRNCPQLAIVDGCENVNEIGYSAFGYCNKLSVFPFGNAIQRIESEAFMNCSSLPETLVMPASLTTLGWSYIFNGSSIRSFDLSQCEQYSSIAYNTFGKCTSLLLPEKGSYALHEWCMNEAQLKELRIPDAVSSINNDHVFPATLERLFVSRTEPINVSDDKAFIDIDFDACTLYVPVGSVDAYSEAKGWYLFTKILECGFIVKTDGHGMVKYDGKDYQNDGAFFPNVGTALTMQIIPSFGYEIATLKVNGTALDFADDGTFTIPATISGGNVEVTFAKKQLQIAISVEGNGSFTIDGQTYTSTTTLPVNGGDVVKVQLQPSTGYFVKQIAIDGKNLLLKNGGLEFATDTIGANTAISIVFSNDVNSVATITFEQEGGGNVSYKNETFEDGSTLTIAKNQDITLKITPTGDFNFQSLSVNGIDVTTNVNDSSYTLNNISANTIVKTFFSSPNEIAVENPNGGELKDLIVAMGSTPSTLRTLKVIGKLTNKDWNFVMSSLSELEVFDISETDVKTIPESAFQNKYNLTTVHLPSTVVTIGNSAFGWCYQLTTVDGCENVQEIGSDAFSQCNKLKDFPFGNKIKKIESYAFNNCSSLPETLVMPASLNTLGWGGIFNGSSIHHFDLSQCTLTGSIAENTFGECTSLVLPENGDYYLSCNALKNAHLSELRLPAVVSGLNCDNVLPTLLERLYVSRTEPISWIDNNAFKNLDFDNCILYVPVGSIDAYKEADYWSNFEKIQEYGFVIKTDSLGTVKYEGKDYQDGDALFPSQGAALTMQITPSFGYEIATLKVNGTALDFTNDGTFTVPASIAGGKIEVTFAKKQLQIAVSIEGNGSFTIDGQTYTATTTLPVNGGDCIKVQLQPTTGYFVKQITIDGKELLLKNGGLEFATDVIGANASISIIFSNDVNSVATITFEQEGGGNVSYKNETFEDGSTLTIAKNQDITLKITPTGDFNFQSLSVNGTDVTTNVNEGNYSISNVVANTTVKTIFTSPNVVTVDNPNGGELKDMLAAMGCTPSSLRVLKVTGKMTNKDWNYVKSNMYQLEVFDISETDVKIIPENIFQDRQYLTTVHLPSTVVTIDRWAFSYCYQLTTVDGCENVKEIRERAFSQCNKLANFPFGEKLQSIESAVFENCSSLPESLVMPASVTSLGWDNMFNGSSVRRFDLSQCEIRSDFGYNAFGNCTSLLLPEKGDYRLCYQALKDAELTELRLPAALTYMYGEDVLPTMLERLYVSRTEPMSIEGNRVFRNLDFDNCTLYVPQGSKEAYSAVDYWSEFTNIKEFGMLVTVGEQGKVRAGTQTMMGTTAFFPTTSSVTFEIIPNAGWHADAVTVNGTNVPFADNQFTLSGDQLSGKLAVSFAINQFALQLQLTGDGQVKLGSLVYTSNQVITVDSLSTLNFTLAPAEGLVVSAIAFNGQESVVQNGGTTYVTPAITANSTLAITFAAAGAEGEVATYAVTTGEGGSVEYKNTTLLPETTIQVKKGENAVFTIKPEDYYIIEKVLFNGTSVIDKVDADGKLTIENVDANATLEVAFRVNAEIAVNLDEGIRLTNLLNEKQKQLVTKLTISGRIQESDFFTMRDEMPMLSVIDMWQAETDYIPYQAFCTSGEWWSSSVGKKTLTSVRLPQGTHRIGGFAFAGCTNLKEVNFTELTQLQWLEGRTFAQTGLNVIDLSKTQLTDLGGEFYQVKNLENIKLPKTLTNLNDAFYQSSLTEIDLSECTNLKSLSNTFYECKNLVKVTLPEGLTSITSSAFGNCEKLTTINFPSSLVTISGNAFYHTNLQKVDLSSLTNLQSIGDGAFQDCYQLSEVLIPSSLVQLGNSAFNYCRKLTSIDLSKTKLQNIPENVFSSCEALESVKLPKTIETIDRYAFAWNNKLGGVLELGADFTSIGECAFEGTQISVIRIDATTPPAISSNSMPDAWVAAFVPEGYADVYKSTPIWEDRVILDKEVHADVIVSFEGNLANDIVEQALIAPATVTHLKVHGPIGPKDFAIMRSNMTLLYDLDLEDAECNIIPENAFLDKKVLMNVKLPRELLIIQENAFRGCSSLKGTLTLPAGVTTIGWGAFQGCTSLEKVELSEALEVIRGYAFEGCSSLQQELTFPPYFTSLGVYAFANCRSLYGTLKFNSEFYMFMGNEGYWSSEGRTFENCSNIEVVDMSECEYLYQLPQGVFSRCYSLHTVMLPPYLERIEYYGFEENTSLRTIEFPSSLMYIDDYAFQNCSSLKSINLSDCPDFGTLGGWAFANNASLESVNLPASLNWIGSYAFSGCRKLGEINVEALEPADLGEYVFQRVHTERCVLSIPTGTYSDYLSAPQWGEFVSMRKAIDVTLDEGASLSYSSGGEDVASARRAHRAPAAESQQGNVSVKDGSSLYVAENDNVTFYINPDENVSIKQVLFNGEDVTGQLQANAFVTPSLTDNASFKVLLNVDGPITVKELRMLNQNMNIKVAESAKITATVYPTNATNKTVIWTSSNEDVATVTNEGLVTGVNAGRAIITAKTEDGNFEQKCELVVMSNDYYVTLSKEINTFVENTCILPVMLHNADAAQGIQFDVYLPEGLYMAYEWRNDFGVELSGRANSHSVSAARRSDGSIRVVVYSLNGQSFSDNDGQLLSLHIATREAVGDYKVDIRNIHISGPNSFNFSAPDYTTNIRVADYPLGDSNGNGEVTISDATNIVENILERWTERFIKKASDVNGDGVITVSDVTGTIDIILERPATTRSLNRAASAANDDKIFINDFKLCNGQQQTINLQLTNTGQYTAFQCDIVLPEGLTIAENEQHIPMVNISSANAQNHIVQANYVSSGALRLLVMSLNNSAFAANGNDVVNLTIEANSETLGQKIINIENVRLVDVESHTESQAASTQATVDIVDASTDINNMAYGVDMKVSVNEHEITVIANADAVLRLVGVDGKQRTLKVKAGSNSFYIPQSGVYMLQGRKIVIK